MHSEISIPLEIILDKRQKVTKLKFKLFLGFWKASFTIGNILGSDLAPCPAPTCLLKQLSSPDYAWQTISLRNNDKGQLEACKDKDICTTGKHGAIKPRKISLPSHTHITFKSQSPQVTKIDLTLGSKRPSFAIHSSTLWKEGKKRGWVLQRQAEPQQLNADKLLAIKREENCDLIQPLPLSLLSLLAISTTARLDLWRFLIGDIRQPEERWSYQTPQLCLWRDESCAALMGQCNCAVTWHFSSFCTKEAHREHNLCPLQWGEETGILRWNASPTAFLTYFNSYRTRRIWEWGKNGRVGRT